MSLAFSLFCLYPSLIDYLIINDDILKWGFEDTLAELGVGHSVIIILTKIFSIFISLIFSLILFQIGKKMKNKEVGLLMSFLGLFYFWLTDIFYGANQRAFALIIISLFLYSLFVNRNRILLPILVVSSFVYPPVLLIILLNLLINHWKNKKSKIRPRIILLLTLILLFIAIFYHYNISSIVSMDQALEMPEFSSKGRVKVFNENFLNTIGSQSIGISINPALIYLTCLNILLFLIIRKRFRINEKIILFVFSGIILYVLAFVFFLKLYFPSRYIIYTLPLSLILIFCLNIDTVIKRRKSFIYIILLIATLIFFFKFFPQHYLEKCPNDELYRFIDSTHKDSFIVGYPRTIDCIHRFSDITTKNFLFSYEFSPIFYPEYYSQFKKSQNDFFKIYYSDKQEEIEGYCSKYNISIIIVEEELFSEEYLNYGWNWYEKRNRPVWHKMPFANLLKKFNIYFKQKEDRIENKVKSKYQLLYEPFDSYIKNITKEKKTFYLLNISENKKIFNHNGTFIVNCSNI